MKLEFTPQSHEQLGPLLGHSSVMHRLFKQIKKAAAIDIPVLLQGETGTGKDLAAHTIHKLSERSGGPYIPVNLSALPSETIASELFGYEKGAFTGATRTHKGKFELAQNGSLFLDEIESIDEKVQVSLLRVIEQQKFFRLGGKRQISTNARLTAASNESLLKMVEHGTFRKDLFYRLELFPIYLPPLRKRPEDIPLLVMKFVAQGNQVLNKQVTEIEPECMRLLQDFDWPGNIRELKNVVQRAMLMCEGPCLRFDHFSSRIRHTNSTLPVISFKIGTPLREIERAVILHTLELVDNNRTEAARLLGISRRALYNRLNKYHIK